MLETGSENDHDSKTKENRGQELWRLWAVIRAGEAPLPRKIVGTTMKRVEDKLRRLQDGWNNTESCISRKDAPRVVGEGEPIRVKVSSCCVVTLAQVRGLHSGVFSGFERRVGASLQVVIDVHARSASSACSLRCGYVATNARAHFFVLPCKDKRAAILSWTDFWTARFLFAKLSTLRRSRKKLLYLGRTSFGACPVSLNQEEITRERRCLTRKNACPRKSKSRVLSCPDLT